MLRKIIVRINADIFKVLVLSSHQIINYIWYFSFDVFVKISNSTQFGAISLTFHNSVQLAWNEYKKLLK